jgi:hypothetical protein
MHIGTPRTHRDYRRSTLAVVFAAAICLAAAACGSEEGIEGSYGGFRSASGFDPVPSPTPECYTFEQDGSVEFRPGVGVAPSDTGTYSSESGEITWASGRVSVVEEDGDSLRIDDLELEAVEGCD